ncbi:MAG TPA: nucleoside triphosphate pyrophosphohydrolase [Chloroflexi bacterium]|nr:nucleoside triphosphate pyrophosphohydrolase [Chloroflexota bacterium]
MLDRILEQFGLTLKNGVMVIDVEELAEWKTPPFPPTLPAVVLLTNQGNDAVLSSLKGLLLANYPVDHQIDVLSEGVVRPCVLCNVDGQEHIQAIHVPALGELNSSEMFQNIIARLRAPDGCPWDREQTHQSLKMFLLEEAYEMLDALDDGDMQAVKEELGDVLLQIYLHAQIATEKGEFSLGDVFDTISQKMVRRHPHVFGAVEVNGDVGQVLNNWQEIKAKEREENGANGHKGTLDGVSTQLPALMVAQQYQRRAELNGFQWESKEQILAKILEEIGEIAALEADDGDGLAEEFGDLLFALVNLITWYGLEAEFVLRDANKKFLQRFSKMERLLAGRETTLRRLTAKEQISLWEQVKTSY